jgi:hypothetical protein
VLNGVVYIMGHTLAAYVPFNAKELLEAANLNNTILAIVESTKAALDQHPRLNRIEGH